MNLMEAAISRGVEWVQKATSGSSGARRGAGGPDAHGASRGTLSAWVRGVPPHQGQPTLSERGSGVSPARMREIVLKTPTAGAALNAILDYACGVRVHPRNIDPAKKVPPRASTFIRDLLATPNATDTERRYRRKVLRDVVTMGFGAVEIERGVESGGVANLHVLDAARLQMDFDEHGKVRGYNMQGADGKLIIGRDGQHTWPAEDVLFYSLDPISSSQYPTSRIEQLFACAVLESMMLAFIGGRFTDSNVPFGVMDLGDISDTELEDAIALWNQQIEESDHPEHRIIFTGSRGGGAKWLPFGYKLTELEASSLLALVRQQILSILGVTVNEMGESDTVNKANGYNLSFTFKKRAIEPILDEYVQTTTRRLLWEELGFTDCELWYEDIDSRDELLQSQIDDLRLKGGVTAINDVRNRDGQPSIPGGEEPTINLGGSIIPVSMIDDFAQVQLEALQMINLQTKVGIMQALQSMMQPQIDPETGQPIPGTGGDGGQLEMLGSLPLLRGMQPPMKFTTPDGAGSSTTKFKMPKPSMDIPKNAANQLAPPATRGPVQTARQQGVRKEDMSK